MSKIGRQPINIPESVTVNIRDGIISVAGKNGKELTLNVLGGIKPEITEGQITFNLLENTKQAKSNWGTLRALVSNAVEGVTDGFQKILLLEGVGYRIVKDGANLVLSLGFSHQINYDAPQGIEFEVEKNKLTVKGIDKALVGQVAAEIKAFRPVEPYKGKGFRYDGEVVRRKVGKKAGAGIE